MSGTLMPVATRGHTTLYATEDRSSAMILNQRTMKQTPVNFHSAVARGYWKPVSEATAPRESKHYGPGPHASGSPQLVHAASTPRARLRLRTGGDAVFKGGGDAPRRLILSTSGPREKGEAVRDGLDGWTFTDRDGRELHVEAAGNLTIHGSIKTSDGDVVATFRRSFTSDNAVYHSSFSVPKTSDRRKGIGSAFMRKSMELYAENDLGTVHLQAADDGRWVWAKMGFQWGTHDGSIDHNVVKSLRNMAEYEYYPHRAALDGVPAKDVHNSAIELMDWIEDETATPPTPGQVLEYIAGRYALEEGWSGKIAVREFLRGEYKALDAEAYITLIFHADGDFNPPTDEDEVKHYGPGVHPSGSPQLVHAIKGKASYVNPHWNSMVRENVKFEPSDEVKAQFKKWIAERKVTVSVDGHTLEAIVRDGRIKNQFEVGNSTGMYQPDVRARLERELFGHELRVHSDTAMDAFNNPDAYRNHPIYGHLAPPDEPGPGDTYGDVRLVLKDTVRDRTTITMGDSLDAVWSFSTVTAMGTENPSLGVTSLDEDEIDWAVLDDVGTAMDGSFMPTSLERMAGDLGNNSYGTYVEAQIHGGINVNDIEKVSIGWGGAGLSGRPTDALAIIRRIMAGEDIEDIAADMPSATYRKITSYLQAIAAAEHAGIPWEFSE